MVPYLGKESKLKLNKDKYDLIKDSKCNITPAELWKGLPEEFELYFQLVKDLDFSDRPNYQALRKLFKKVMSESNYECDFVFDWMSEPSASHL